MGIKKLLLLISVTFAMATPMALRAQDDVQIPPVDIEAMKGKTVAVLMGSTQDLYFSAYPGINVMRLPQIAEIITAVETDKADYFAVDVAGTIGARLDQKGIGAVYDISSDESKLGIGLRKSDTELKRQFDAFIKTKIEDGSLDSLDRKWTLADDPAKLQLPEFEYAEDAKPLVIGVNTFPPFTFLSNGVWTGFEPEMIYEFASKNGYRPEILLFEFGALIPALVTNKIDMILAFMTITEERAKQVLFSDPYYISGSFVYARVAAAETIEKAKWTERIKESFINNLVVENRWMMILDGFKETFIISIFSILIGILIGALVCWMRLSRSKLLEGIAKVIVELMRGIPMLVFLMLMFYVFLARSGLSGRWIAIFAFAINFGAFVSEIFRTGIQSIDKGQTEAGLALGFSPLQTFLIFIVPQAVRKILPVFKNESISLIKNTSIVGYIAIQDLTKVSDIIRSRTFDAFFSLIVISIIYFVFAWLFGKLLDLCNKPGK